MVLDDMRARERFLDHLRWTLALELRHQHILQSGLVHVTYDPRDIQGLTFGAADAARQLGEVLGCLQRAFRTTDLMTREGMNFWILAPFTQLDPVKEKVRKVLAEAPENGLAIAKSDIRIYLLRDFLKQDAPVFSDVEGFLGHLKQQAPSVNLD